VISLLVPSLSLAQPRSSVELRGQEARRVSRSIERLLVDEKNLLRNGWDCHDETGRFAKPADTTEILAYFRVFNARFFEVLGPSNERIEFSILVKPSWFNVFERESQLNLRFEASIPAALVFTERNSQMGISEWRCRPQR